LKSTNILKSFQSTSSQNSFVQSSRKISFVSEKSIRVNQCIPQLNSKTNQQREKRERRLSIEILKTPFKVLDDEQLKRASVESENSGSNRSSLSSLSGSDSGVETDRPPANISQRRISLEQRFQARARISSPDRAAAGQDLQSNVILNEFTYRRSSSCARTEGRSRRCPDPRPVRPVPASRKISLPQPSRRPEPAPRRRSSLHTLLSPDRCTYLSENV
jgi:hypothetical protein